jgi:predicted phage baseplate assembly protein
VPATQGRRYSESFAIGQGPPLSQMPMAVLRTGPNCSEQYLHTFQNAPLAWLRQTATDSGPLPEIMLVEQPANRALPAVNWMWRRNLLNAEEFEKAFTLDPISFLRHPQPNSDGSSSYQYDGDGGSTIRFGDDVFGEIPESGSIFQLTYRVGGGASGNVAADTINKVDPGAAALITTVTNPFAATGGTDAEPDEQVVRLAPQAFRAVQYRAVRSEDYKKAAETLPWVLRAGTVFRWTGSWLTVFTTADPEGTEKIPIDEHIDLINLLNRYRLAGYESYVPSPNYVSIDLIVTVCAQPSAFRSDVETQVLAALSTAKFPDGTTGFFYFDRFTFGTPLEPSALESAIQSAYGVAGLVSIQYRERGGTPDWGCIPEVVRVSPSQILRMDNDPSRPNRGTLKVIVEGGK